MSSCMEVATLSTAALTAENAIRVYPNPATTYLTVAGAKIGTTASISDLSGKVIFEKTVESDSELISLETIASGVYNLTVLHDNKVHEILKIVITK